MFHSDKFWTRRDFLKLAGQAGLLSAFPTLASAAAANASDTICISILHTTDLHGHILPTADYDGNAGFGGLGRCATQIRRWRRQNPSSILIDVGDVYQGTDVSLRNKGELMIGLFNHLNYDAWVVGNHEFDWGIETFTSALQRSSMPVLAANMEFDGKPAGELSDSQHPFAAIRPLIIKEIAGIKLAIVGVTTPGMPFWLPIELTRGMEFQHPIEPVRRAIAAAKGHGVDAIVLAGHMGLKMRTGGDDFANNVMALTSEFPEAVVFIAGHTHQDIASRVTNGALFTQADHFGIHIGRVDLLFDRSSKRLIHREAICALMDDRVPVDGVVISRSKSQLADSDAALCTPVGEVAETLRTGSRPGMPGELERLIGAAVTEALAERNVAVEGVLHGMFDDKIELTAGPVTLNDIWKLIPYENYVVTAQLAPDEIKAVMEEVLTSHEKRHLVGFEFKTEGRGYVCRIVSIALADGRPLDPGKKYALAFNSFDSRSGGHHFMKLRALLDRPEAQRVLHPLQTRDALIEFFQRHKTVHRIAETRLRRLAA
ncbi:MAG TPA: bifunctional UDP-sugar hydrolase/5'-nucleotidase [Candidatus Udaeobacter sp.]|jgi:2',3'-cyclic-nucleotide 2'-phosphodiesterase/3'-nucleotidase|nr:bifunctional UDP-sugar hydrolase/5'-nucleotidase [Candidatus Udaeobacter sp.]